MASEEKLKALSEVREILRRVEGELDQALTKLEPFPSPIIKGWIRTARERIYVIRSGPLSYPEVLRIARK